MVLTRFYNLTTPIYLHLNSMTSGLALDALKNTLYHYRIMSDLTIASSIIDPLLKTSWEIW